LRENPNAFNGMIPVIAADVITTDLSDSFPANTIVKPRRLCAQMPSAAIPAACRIGETLTKDRG